MKFIVFYFALILSLLVLNAVNVSASGCTFGWGCEEDEYCDKSGLLGLSGQCIRLPMAGEKCSISVGCYDGICQYGVCQAMSPSL